MKKFLKASLFCVIFLLIYIYASIVFIPKSFADPGGAKYYRGKGYQSEAKNSLEILAFGNSDLYAGFTPLSLYEDYGYTSYSCGVSKQDLRGVYNLLKDSTKYQSPKLVILETDCIYYKTKKKNETVEDFTNKAFFIFRNHGRWKKLKPIDFIKMPNSKTKDYLKGHVFRDNDSNFKFSPYMGDENASPELIKKLNLGYLNKIVNLCKDKKYQILFIEFPSATSWNYAKHKGVKEYIKDKDIPFIDMNLNVEEIGIRWDDHFFDRGNHLNCFGAKIATKYIGKYLEENYQLTDYRNNPKYHEWDKCLELYNKQFKNN